MRNKVFLTFLSALSVLFFWHYVGTKVILKDDSSKSFSKLQCVSYAPFTKDESPYSFEKGLVLKEENIRKDLELFSKYTNCIRTYSTVGLELIPKVAKELNMQMLMGAWIGKSDKDARKEIDTLIQLATEYKDIVKAVIVGNEVLLRGDSSEQRLHDFIVEVKTALPDTPVTYADVWEYWLKYPKIKEVTDFVTIHILPYWEDDPQNIHDSIEHLANVRMEVEKELGTSNILIGETGWPSEGRAREDAMPSKINQAMFVRDFVKLANEKNWNYNIIEAVDQPWKRVNEGAVGGFWGLFDKDRGDKSVFKGDVSNFPNYTYLAFGSLFLVLGFSYAMLRKKVFSITKIATFTIINTIFAILFMLQVEQYHVITRNFFEFIWAILLLGTQIFVYYFMLAYILRKKQSDVIPSMFFYASAFFAFIMTTNLAFNGRYENFEIYGFIILAISFLWLYIPRFNQLQFGKFEKLLSLILVINTIIVFYNETSLNIFSNIWVILSLIFAFILYKGTTKEIKITDLKEIVVYTLVFAIGVYLFKIGFVSNKALANACNIDSKGIACGIKDFMGHSIYFGYVGFVSLIISIIALVVNTKKASLVALFFAVASTILSNTFLGAVSFIIVAYILTKENKKLV